MAKLSSKGQIFFPVEFRPALGESEDKGTVHFRLDETERIVVLTLEEIPFAPKATITADGLLTIPKRVRDFLRAKAGDQLEMYYDEPKAQLQLRKQSELLACPVCHGTKNVQGYPCLVCLEKGFIQVEPWHIQLSLFVKQSFEHRIGTSVVWKPIPSGFIAGHVATGTMTFPEIRFHSKRLPESIVLIFEDHYQLLAIKELLAESYVTGLIPEFDLIPELMQDLEYASSLLLTDPAKEDFKRWYTAEILQNIHGKEM